MAVALAPPKTGDPMLTLYRRLLALLKRPAPVLPTPSRWMTLDGHTPACLMTQVGFCRLWKAYGLDGSWWLVAFPAAHDYARYPTRRLAEVAAQRETR